MRPALLLLAAVGLPGCALFNNALDRVSDRVVKEMVDYCSVKYHRRLAYYVFIEGELEPHGIEMAVICPGDPEEGDVEAE